MERKEEGKPSTRETQPATGQLRVQAETLEQHRPINDVMEHRQQIMGQSMKPADLATMPAAVRWFGYFFLAFIAVGGLTMLGIALFERIR
jgi:hypothetical protein